MELGPGLNRITAINFYPENVLFAINFYRNDWSKNTPTAETRQSRDARCRIGGPMNSRDR